MAEPISCFPRTWRTTTRMSAALRRYSVVVMQAVSCGGAFLSSAPGLTFGWRFLHPREPFIARGRINDRNLLKSRLLARFSECLEHDGVDLVLAVEALFEVLDAGPL